MATNFTSSTLPSVYNDDWDQTDNYHQVLFNSGRSLQARELTTLQTMIYAEMARLGRNVFKEGAAVSSGNMAVNNDYEYVKIASTNAGGAFSDLPIGTVLKDTITGLEARVLEVKALGGEHTLDTIYVHYTNKNNAAPTATPATFGDGVTLYDQSGGGYELVTHVPNASGKASRFDVGAGDFFVVGRFVQANAQSIILSPYDVGYTGSVGFKVVQEVITVNDTQDLYDNTGGQINRSAPGADRYRIRLTLVRESDTTSDDTFVFLARIENGKIVEQIQESDAYNKINELLALRTDEESGDYVINPFRVYFEDGVVGDSSLDLIVSEGLAYVNGFRAQNPSTVRLEVPRPVATETVTNDVVPIIYGNYFNVNAARSLPNLDYTEINISTSATDPASGVIGTCRVRAVQEGDNSTYKAYVFDVAVDSDQSLSAARSIGTSSTDYMTIQLNGTKAELKETIDNDLLMPTTRPRSASLGTGTITMAVQRHVSAATDGAGDVDISGELGVGESFVDKDLWVFASASNDFDTPASINTSTGVITGLTGTSTTYDILYYVQKSASVRTKSLNTATATLNLQTATDVNGTSYRYYDFGIPDVYQVDSARNTSASGIDMLGRFTFDDGQRDNFYADSRLILNTEDSAPNQVYVNYSHFTRGSGDFFAPQSYNGAVTYGNIPTHVRQDGTEIRLFNYLDFRPDKNDGTFSNINFLPRVSTNITADIDYYLPRADKVLLTEDGDVQLLMGEQAENPQFKPTPDNTLELYKILMNANSFDENDMTITPIENKGYTMKDIGEIEAKVDRLEEYTNRKFLELEQKIAAAFDSDGNVRTSSAVQIDDCSDHTQTDTTNPDHRSSLDPESRLIRPMADENNIRLVINNTLSQGVVKKGDNVYLQYDSASWKYQSLASTHVNINPFGLVDNVGTLKLSPSADEWKESKELATSALNGANKVDRVQAYLWNNWLWNWQGRNVDDLQLDYDRFADGDPQSRRRQVLEARDNYNSSTSRVPNRYYNGKFVTRPLGSSTIRSLINGKYVDLAIIPWMRSRKVYFKAQGLTPNTKFTPFFDGQDVSSWCREESSFVQWADRTDDIGNQYRGISQHPAGSSDLISDQNGEIIGSFFIPNQKPQYLTYRYGKRGRIRRAVTRFRTGVREFRLLDINRNDYSEATSKAFAYYSAIGQVDKAWGGFWNLRGWRWVAPWNYLWRNTAFTPRELQNTLNNTTVANVNILNPQLSGQWGPETTALTSANLSALSANGQLSQVLSDYVDVNKNNFAGNNVNSLSMPQNPLAQTFHVDNQFGAFITKVDLYFRQKDTGNLPVSIHIRPVAGGKPSHTTIVPDSHVYKNPSEVTAIGTAPQLSVAQARPTTFEFDEPLYLQPNTSYAIVVTSASTEYELFTAKTGQKVLGSTSRTVTTQPAPGSLFLPQNGFNWLEAKDQDLMFKISRAVFQTGGGSLVVENARLPAYALGNNPIRTYEGTGRIYVEHMCHGLKPGDGASLDSCDAVNGITAVQLNDATFVVDSADLYGYTVTTAGTATSSGNGGGERVLSRYNHNFSTVDPILEQAVPKFTSIETSAKFTSGTYISGSGTRLVQDTTWKRITPNTNVDFATPKTIYSQSAEDSASLGRSTYIKMDFKSSNDYVSPVVDLQRASLAAVGYCMDNPDVTPYVNPVSETAPYGCQTGHQHVGTPVTLENAAVGLDARIQVDLPEGGELQFFYRTATADENIKDKYWIEQPLVNALPNDNSGTYREAHFLPGGPEGALKPFNQAQYKVAAKAKDLPVGLKDISINYLAV